ncbi:MAG TPA: endolytic transglycosylase MltG [Patescibacteria group bacterium]|nr:endolytic transglycosylase MltG [Patescibacteria group bacterium]
MKKIIFYLIILLIIAGFLGSGWFVFEVLNPVKSDKVTNFSIQSGEGVNQISANLKKQGIINSSFVFETYAYLKDIEANFKAGEYSLPTVINIKRLVELLTSGESANNPILLVKEGDTIDDIDQSLAGQGKFVAGDLQAALQQLNQDFFTSYDFLADKPASAGLEGYLFPDTYYFFNYSNPEDLIRKMLANFDRKFTADLKAEIKKQAKTIFEVITMASIIEREAKIDPQNPNEDANIIAGIFWKRLESGMPLQADSTIEYKIKREPTPDDLKIDSLYNTYLYPGLPPGPISNPGLAAIRAATYPQESEYWFFITKGDQVYYAKDFAEHQKNISQYLQ